MVGAITLLLTVVLWQFSHDTPLIDTLQSNLPWVILMAGTLISGLLTALLIVLHQLKLKQNDLRHNQNKVKRKVQEINLLLQSTQAITQSDNFEDALKKCLHLVCLNAGWPVGHAYMPNEAQTQLVPTKIWHINKKLDISDFKSITEETTFEPGIGLPGRIWVTNQPAWIDDIQQDHNFPRANLCQKISLHSAVGFPISIQNRTIAILEFFTTNTRHKDNDMLNLFLILGNQLGRLWEKREIERRVHDSNERSRLLLDSAGEGIYGLDLEGRATFVNPAAEVLLGYHERELIGQEMHPLMHHTHPDGSPYSLGDCPIYSTLHDGQTRTISDEVLWHKDGTCFPVEYTCTPMYTKGELVGAVLTFNDTTKQVEAQKQLEALAHHDYLTGLYNRALFTELFSASLLRAQRKNAHLALLYIDLDGFKEVNDTHGHDAGDAVLKEVAIRLKHALRGYDIIARLGGDEFAAVLEEVEDCKVAVKTAQDIVADISKPYTLQVHVEISACVGIAMYPEAGSNSETLLKSADTALYEAKQKGAGQVTCYKP